jgi:membrane glycosyltransferase
MLVFSTTLGAMALLNGTFQADGISPLEFLLLLLYAVLFSWICASFWTAILGFWVLLFRIKRWSITAMLGEKGREEVQIQRSRTALVMPIYNENPVRIFAGVKAIWGSLVATSHQDDFDLFLLSDTRDPEIWVEEELRWRQTCLELKASGHLFYRNRSENTDRKSGNLADFIRNWGGRYRYMIILDADSLMEGTTLMEMVRLMDRHPRVALIQVPAVAVNHESLFARILQFAGSLYSQMYTAGLNFWQAHESNFWGHNAILRVEAFARHCGLPHLPGKEPFGGPILSHDFVESALLSRAGWEVWLAYDLNGSYEEIPTTLIDYAKRDRRWCQGNLQHAQLITARNLRPLSRIHLTMGVMSYLASPLWLLFLLITGIEAYIKSQERPVYFFGENLFPVWPISYTFEMTTVLIVTLTMLFLPKILALVLLLFQPRRLRQYGGTLKVSLSVFLETLFSTLLAPVLMLFQTKFVLAILSRRTIGWPAQQRSDHATGLQEAASAHGEQMLVALVAGALSYGYVPAFFWWFTPVLFGLLLVVPLSMVSSRITPGRKARRLGLFLTPEEVARPEILQRLDKHLKDHKTPLHLASRSQGLWIQPILNPLVHALHLSLLPGRTLSRWRRHYLEGLSIHLLEEGPEALTPGEKRDLLSDRDSLMKLHTLLWARTRIDEGVVRSTLM